MHRIRTAIVAAALAVTTGAPPARHRVQRIRGGTRCRRHGKRRAGTAMGVAAGAAATGPSAVRSAAATVAGRSPGRRPRRPPGPGGAGGRRRAWWPSPAGRRAGRGEHRPCRRPAHDVRAAGRHGPARRPVVRPGESIGALEAGPRGLPGRRLPALGTAPRRRRTSTRSCWCGRSGSGSNRCQPASGPRVGLVVAAAQPLPRHVRVDLRAGQRRVARAAPAPSAGRRRPPAGGWRPSGAARAATGAGRPAARGPGGDDLARRRGVEPAAARAEQQGGAAARARPAPGRPRRSHASHGPRRPGAPNGDGALLGALAEHPHHAAVQVDVVDVQPAQLGRPGCRWRRAAPAPPGRAARPAPAPSSVTSALPRPGRPPGRRAAPCGRSRRARGTGQPAPDVVGQPAVAVGPGGERPGRGRPPGRAWSGPRRCAQPGQPAAQHGERQAVEVGARPCRTAWSSRLTTSPTYARTVCAGPVALRPPGGAANASTAVPHRRGQRRPCRACGRPRAARRIGRTTPVTVRHRAARVKHVERPTRRRRQCRQMPAGRAARRRRLRAVPGSASLLRNRR